MPFQSVKAYTKPIKNGMIIKSKNNASAGSRKTISLMVSNSTAPAGLFFINPYIKLVSDIKPAAKPYFATAAA